MRPQKKFRDSQFTIRWSRRVADEGYTPIPVCLLRCFKDFELKHQEAMVLFYLMSFWFYTDTPNDIYVKANTIAKALGIGYSSVGRIIRRLEAKQFLHREFQQGSTNIYHLDDTIHKVSQHVLSTHPPQKRVDPYSNITSQPSPSLRSNKVEVLNKGFKKEDLIRVSDIMKNRFGMD